MNRPPRKPVPRMIGNMNRGPRPFNNSWRHRGPHPPTGFHCRPSTHFGSPVQNSTNANNEEHWCETCDRAFPSADQLERHKQQHQKCNIDGCQFVAHPKVITKHIQMQHSSGLYKKIGKLDNPEAINKWREERKKRYPTKTNIEKKAAECKEKIERGEKMALKHDRNDKGNKQRTTDPASGNKRRNSFDTKNQNQRTNRNLNQTQTSKVDHPPPKKVPKVIPKIPCVVDKNRLKPFTGILSISMNDDDDDDKVEDLGNATGSNNTLIEDDDYDEPVIADHPKQGPVQEPALCGALTSLMCEYGSTDDETDEKANVVVRKVGTAEPVKILDKDIFLPNIETVKDIEPENNYVKEASINKDNKNTDITQENETEINGYHGNSDNDSPEEVKTIKSNVEDLSFSQEEPTKSKIPQVHSRRNIPPRNNNHRQNNKYKHKVPSTLLHKLLHKEIRQERNIVLQCIRYIKKMNYFDKSEE